MLSGGEERGQQRSSQALTHIRRITRFIDLVSREVHIKQEPDDLVVKSHLPPVTVFHVQDASCVSGICVNSLVQTISVLGDKGGRLRPDRLVVLSRQ